MNSFIFLFIQQYGLPTRCWEYRCKHGGNISWSCGAYNLGRIYTVKHIIAKVFDEPTAGTVELTVAKQWWGGVAQGRTPGMFWAETPRVCKKTNSFIALTLLPSAMLVSRAEGRPLCLEQSMEVGGTIWHYRR